MESLAEELESVAVSSVYDAGSSAPRVQVGAETTWGEEESGSEFSDDGRSQAWEKETEIESRW